MTLRTLSLLLLTAVAVPAVTISPVISSPTMEVGSPVTIDFLVDNSAPGPGNPDAALWLLITSIEVEVLGPSLLSDFTYTDFVSGIIDGLPVLLPQPTSAVLIGPAGAITFPFDSVFVTGVQIEPLLSALAGLHDIRLTLHFDWFENDPYDPFTNDLLPGVLADGSNSVTLPTFQLEVTSSAVPEPSTVIAGLGLLMLALRRMRNATQVR